MRIIPLALASLIALALPAAAPAATTVGVLPADGATYSDDYCPPGTGGAVWRAIANVDAGYPGPPYQVPPGGGVITRFETRDIAAAGTPFAFRVMRTTPYVPAPPRGGTQFTSGPVARVPATSAGPATITATAARVKVSGGEVLGISRPAGVAEVNCAFVGGGNDALAIFPTGEPPESGEDFAHPATPGYRPNVRAILEPDADKDGFGDETQDGCPSNAQLQGSCTIDVVASAAAAEPAIPLGGVGVVTFTVRNAGAARVPVQLAGTLPDGLQLIATTAEGGCAGLTCSLGELDPGEAGFVLAVVRGTAPGAKAVAGTATSPIADPNPANNAASAALNVVPGAPALCRVPTLKNLSRDAASKALKAAGCKLGKSARPKRKLKGRKLRVRSQSIPARTQVANGTKVDLTLRYAAKKKR